ncbi:hypothetical protein TI39_contig305g00041 [Zymoseptoria brevis]|uniref:RING-type domain-containing protein n=1 Tax=Zymoseptoria brevis TaxID=1047168 RepID=A0A0F4GVG3_9PEZI|nr:hypothetical protein TI39_contig305g00041 [Zymoseptoria brevis]
MGDRASWGAAGGSYLERENEINIELRRLKAEIREDEEQRKAKRLEYEEKLAKVKKLENEKKQIRNPRSKRRAESNNHTAEEERSNKRAKPNGKENLEPSMGAQKSSEDLKEHSSRKQSKPKKKEDDLPQTKAKKASTTGAAPEEDQSCDKCWWPLQDPQQLASCSHVYCKDCLDVLGAEAPRRGQKSARCMICDKLDAPPRGGDYKGKYRRPSVEEVDEDDDWVVNVERRWVFFGEDDGA